MRWTQLAILSLAACVPWLAGANPPPSGSPPARGGGLHVVGGGGYRTYGSGSMANSTIRFEPPPEAAAPRIAAPARTAPPRVSSPIVRGGILNLAQPTFREEEPETPITRGGIESGGIRYAEPAPGPSPWITRTPSTTSLDAESPGAEIPVPAPAREDAPPPPAEAPILTLPTPNETVWIRGKVYYRAGNDYYRPVFSGNYVKYVRVDPNAPPPPREPLPDRITFD